MELSKELLKLVTGSAGTGSPDLPPRSARSIWIDGSKTVTDPDINKDKDKGNP